ncbi:MAG: helix-turn-helix domain-containing protein [Burkholderiales bacterium]
MSEAPAGDAGLEAGPGSRSSAGALLRAARQAQGLHIAALAASIKVPQGKLEALEGDRLDELPDNTFARALAKTVCRALKIDPAPVLALMPGLGEQGLDKVHQGLNTTYRDRPGRAIPADMSILRRPAIWLPLLIVLAAGFVFLMPQEWIVQTRPPAEAASAPIEAATPAPAPADAASAAALMASATVMEPVVAAAIEAASAPGAVDAPGAAAASLLEFKVTGESWIEVLDANGATLLQRKLEPGEFVGLDGTPPFRLKIGNAVETRLSFRGQAVDLKAATRDNVARLELK